MGEELKDWEMPEYIHANEKGIWCNPMREEERKNYTKYIREDIYDIEFSTMERYANALRSICNNTCCHGCSEAALVAKEALLGNENDIFPELLQVLQDAYFDKPGWVENAQKILKMFGAAK